MSYTKGELLDFSDKIITTNIDYPPVTIFKVMDNRYVDGKSNAKELVRRWNSQPDLLYAAKIGLAYINAIKTGFPRPILELDEDKKDIEAAIAKAEKF